MLKLQDGRVLDIEELYWENVRTILKPLVPDLVEIIDQISPNKNYTFYKARYPFGSKILNKTEAYLPLMNGGAVSFQDPLLPPNLKENLYYDPATSNPFGIILSKKSEFFLTIGNRIMPYMAVMPGEIFGLARILDNLDLKSPSFSSLSFFMWELTSGVRSLFMLPKISDNIFHNRLKKTYGLTAEKPNSYQDHWNVFKEIAHNEKSPWRSEFLFFSNKWIEKLKDKAWSKLYGYFQSNNRLSYWFWRNILSWQIIFNVIENNKNIRLSSYITDTAKHLFAISVGSVPGFSPAKDDMPAPIELLKEAYIHGYYMNDYMPIIMETSHFSLKENIPVYYSINYPTLAQSDPQAFKGKSFITLLDEVQRVVEKYQEGLLKEPLAISTSLYNAAKFTKFDFYHNNPGRYMNIKNDSLIPSEDLNFQIDVNRKFPKHSAFLRGCIKIS